MEIPEENEYGINEYFQKELSLKKKIKGKYKLNNLLEKNINF